MPPPRRVLPTLLALTWATPAAARPCVDALELMQATRDAASVIDAADETWRRFEFAGRMRGTGGRRAGGVGPLVRIDALGDLDACGFDGMALALDQISVAGALRIAGDDDQWAVELIALSNDVNLAEVVRSRTTTVDPETGTQSTVSSTAHYRLVGQAQTYVGLRVTATEDLRLTAAIIGDKGTTGETERFGATPGRPTGGLTRGHLRAESPTLGLGLDLMIDAADQPAEWALLDLTLPVGTLAESPIDLDLALSWRRAEERAVFEAGGQLFGGLRPYVTFETSRRILRGAGLGYARASTEATGEGWARFGAGVDVEVGYSHGEALRAAVGGGRFGGGGVLELAWVMPVGVTPVIGFGGAYNSPALLDRVPGGADHVETRFSFDLYLGSW